MKYFVILLSAVIFFIFTVNLYTLKTELEKDVHTKDSTSSFDPKPVRRAKIVDRLNVPPVFDVKAPEPNTSPPKKNDPVEKKITSLHGLKNQLKDLRVKGIIVSKEATYAVLASVENNKETEAKKVFKDDTFKGYTLSKIYPGHVELLNESFERTKLGVFKAYKK